MSDKLISIDAESNGLAGRAFAVALTLSDSTGELDQAVFRCPIGEVTTDPWVVENVLPAIADVPENPPRADLRTACTGLTARWCPIHGDCTCQWDGYGPEAMDDPNCPLHSWQSTHPDGRTRTLA